MQLEERIALWRARRRHTGYGSEDEKICSEIVDCLTNLLHTHAAVERHVAELMTKISDDNVFKEVA